VSLVDLQVVQESDEENALLQVLQATRQDSGIYEARVENELGHEMSAFSVNVLGKQKQYSSYSMMDVVQMVLFRL